MKRLLFCMLFAANISMAYAPIPSLFKNVIRAKPDISLGAPKIGYASFYSVKSNGGRHTASGIRLCDNKYTAASCVYPLGSIVRVINPQNNKAVDVKIIDRGPYAVSKDGDVIYPLRRHPHRIIDLSPIAARALYNLNHGITKVKIYKIK
jgi:rare lipoprotein A